ncbi:YqjF family protein [Deinococcus oregonensis]|uniref:YqjF family protein n=1 Tax=Deinococcus oregonensis TaxID=1805970 RepID=A0ABV6ATZ0_9DEIO
MNPRPWVLQMAWQDLLFLHWPVPAAVLRPYLPTRVPLDTWNGQAWLSVVAFQVAGFRPRGFPLGLDFAQMNVRTYVKPGGVPGIWTLSLDAGHWLAVLGARAGYALPYFLAEAALRRTPEGVTFHSSRMSDPSVGCDVHYRPAGPARAAALGTLDYWLTERRSLFTVGWTGQLWREDVQHERWPLQPTTIMHETCTAPLQVGVVPVGHPLAHYARQVHVKAFLPRLVAWPEQAY